MVNYINDSTNQLARYKITAECTEPFEHLIIAGFCSNVQTENILYRHLQNVCKQSKGNFSNAHTLINDTITHWQNTFNLPAVQFLKNINTEKTACRYNKICLYKINHQATEELLYNIYL
ncbi:MAG TPA: hypothetical protein PLU36_02435 [Chitinophagaceae bacterium]|nr:hypothetical protein [Chitinophagaceae bacterium]HNE92906.1 hypothetical protein [Chitinophagaceae bacterium]HNF29043.1 hypothetical protein [Chitinophagaceae bacterium]HNM35205.1 hypothetical protein [Chitinophagaceae bacterium]